jgi:bifunctional non-homologous end joining protein LigD
MKPIVPFEPISSFEFPQGEQWTAQIKWDGTRILTYADGKETLLYNRKGNERTRQYKELTDIQNYCNADSVILDGEVIALENGVPSFHEVMKRDSLRKQQSIDRAAQQIPVIYMIFDVLFYNGEWITDQSLKGRQALLEEIILPGEQIQIVPNYDNMEQLFEVVKEHQLEGIVCKDMNSTYRIDGKDKRWQKKKWFKDVIAVIGGVTHRAGTVNSLLLGLYDAQGQLWYIGHAGTGKLKQEDWKALTHKAKELAIHEMPFRNIPERNKDTVWIQPVLTVKVNFMEWTVNQTLRQPSIQAFVSIPPRECVF